MKLRGKVAHVTGAGAGIGRAIALRLGRERALVVVSDVDEAGGRETVERIAADGGEAAFTRADVARDEDVRAMVAFTEERFGGLDLLVNNAGGAPEPYFPDAEPAQWSGQVAVNLLGVMLGTFYAVQAMRRRGGGAILNVSSVAGIGFEPHDAPEYAASKAGVWRLTAALGPLAHEGIRINCVCPDWVETEGVRAEREAMGEDAWANVAPATLVQPGEIADVAVLLIADTSLAGRVALCPHDGEWGLVPVDGRPALEPLPGLER
jgi:NAD(P)-dependent dehydrogenase (short-subunit alcohol dehydrogenase family)